MDQDIHFDRPLKIAAAGSAADRVARIGYSEHEIAASIGVSVHWVRKDRLSARRLPFYRLGDRVVYDLDRVREALSTLEVGGQPATKSRKIAA